MGTGIFFVAVIGPDNALNVEASERFATLCLQQDALQNKLVIGLNDPLAIVSEAGVAMGAQELTPAQAFETYIRVSKGAFEALGIVNVAPYAGGQGDMSGTY